MVDEALVIRARENDQIAGKQILDEFQTMAIVTARRYDIPGVSLEDRIAECMLALTRAIQTYDSSKGSAFKTYVTRLMDRRLADLWRKMKQKKAVPLTHLFSADTTNADGFNDYDIAESEEPLPDEVLERRGASDQLLHQLTASFWQRVVHRDELACRMLVTFAEECMPCSLRSLHADFGGQASLFGDGFTADQGGVVEDVAMAFGFLQAVVAREIERGSSREEIAHILGISRNLVDVTIASFAFMRSRMSNT